MECGPVSISFVRVSGSLMQTTPKNFLQKGMKRAASRNLPWVVINSLLHYMTEKTKLQLRGVAGLMEIHYKVKWAEMGCVLNQVFLAAAQSKRTADNTKIIRRGSPAVCNLRRNGARVSWREVLRFLIHVLSPPQRGSSVEH